MNKDDKIIIINGPNLNLLGTREPEFYGIKTLDNIKEDCTVIAKSLGVNLEFHQSNDESDIINWIQSAAEKHGLIINAGAYTHTSIAIHDALKSSNSPAIEVHISNPYRRESFRQKSYISPVCDGIVSGFGFEVYKIAIFALNQLLGNTDE